MVKIVREPMRPWPYQEDSSKESPYQGLPTCYCSSFRVPRRIAWLRRPSKFRWQFPQHLCARLVLCTFDSAYRAAAGIGGLSVFYTGVWAASDSEQPSSLSIDLPKCTPAEAQWWAALLAPGCGWQAILIIPHSST